MFATWLCGAFSRKQSGFAGQLDCLRASEEQILRNKFAEAAAKSKAAGAASEAEQSPIKRLITREYANSQACHVLGLAFVQLQGCYRSVSDCLSSEQRVMLRVADEHVVFFRSLFSVCIIFSVKV